jgi:hypothetical protein
MKYCYNIAIQDGNGRMQLYIVVASTMAAAISWAQGQANTTNEPTTVSNMTPTGISYIEP